MRIAKTAIALLLAIAWLGGAVPVRAQDVEALRIWKEFVSDLRAGKMENPERYRLLNAAWNDSFVGWMKILREGVDWDKTKATPEIYRVGDEIKYVMPVWQKAEDGLREGGEKVTLEKLDDKEALVRWTQPLFLEVYRRASHLKTWISVEDYRRLFETIWQNRASAAGWNLAIVEESDAIVMRFSR